MRPKSKQEEMEFVGVMPRNKTIVDQIRRQGYIGVMFNKDDFMDAVIWASNLVNDYERFTASVKDRVVIPIEELPYEKPDLVNAFILLIIYYHRKGNLVVAEELKKHFWTVAKFQDIPHENVSVMAGWDEYMSEAKRRMDRDDFSTPEIGKLEGTEKIFEHYKALIAKEKESFQEELRKEKGLKAD